MAGLARRLIGGLAIIGSAALLLVAACSASSGPSNGFNSGGSNSGSGGSGASSSGGTAGTINLSGGAGGAGNSGGTLGAGGGCGFQSYGGKPRPLDMYIMMDESGSMDGTRWNSVKSAITSFVNSGAPVAGIGVGIQFFPLAAQNCPLLVPPTGCPQGCVVFAFPFLPPICVADSSSAECQVNSYLPPAVMIQPLPNVAPQIIAAMNNATPSGDTPTVPAMKSAVQATVGYAKKYPTHKVIIVLATDGEPNACSSDTQGVADQAKAAYQANPSVTTFVIGLGSVQDLDKIAKAGGSTQAIDVSDANATQEFINAMNQIRGQALGCQYVIPAGANSDPNKVNVFYTPKNAQGDYVLYVSSAAQCQGKAGWYYDRDAQNNPTGIELCPASCDLAQHDGGTIDIRVGCQTQIRPPS